MDDAQELVRIRLQLAALARITYEEADAMVVRNAHKPGVAEIAVAVAAYGKLLVDQMMKVLTPQ